MALTSQAAESEERNGKEKQVLGKKRAADDHVQGQRINKKRHQNVHKVHAAVWMVRRGKGLQKSGPAVGRAISGDDGGSDLRVPVLSGEACDPCVLVPFLWAPSHGHGARGAAHCRLPSGPGQLWWVWSQTAAQGFGEGHTGDPWGPGSLAVALCLQGSLKHQTKSPREGWLLL
jgi:hypothetical protein